MEFLIVNFNAIASAILLACFTAYLVWRNNFKSRQANYAAAFRAAFSDAILNLREIDVPSGQVVSAFRLQHLNAIQEFRGRVPYFRRSGFSKAENSYRQCCENCLESGVFAIAASESTAYAVANRKALLESIHRLLSYAQDA